MGTPKIKLSNNFQWIGVKNEDLRRIKMRGGLLPMRERDELCL
jgi:hypothetical protein